MTIYYTTTEDGDMFFAIASSMKEAKKLLKELFWKFSYEDDVLDKEEKQNSIEEFNRLKINKASAKAFAIREEFNNYPPFEDKYDHV